MSKATAGITEVSIAETIGQMEALYAANVGMMVISLPGIGVGTGVGIGDGVGVGEGSRGGAGAGVGAHPAAVAPRPPRRRRTVLRCMANPPMIAQVGALILLRAAEAGVRRADEPVR